MPARVFVLDRHGEPLQPCHPARARQLLAAGRARVHDPVLFTIRLTDRTREDSVVDGVQVGIDPGSRSTGLAVFTTTDTLDPDTGEITTARTGIWLGELIHRGLQIKKALQQRANYRGRRRSANLRYRKPRFDNRTRAEGWLPPSLQHRADTTHAWVRKLTRIAPVTAIWVEAVRFDTQALLNPEITGVQYQQGTLFGYEVREYLLEKYGRACVYCDAQNVPLNIDHVRPKARGGSDRVTNLTLACIDCNQRKGKQLIEEFVTDPHRLARIKARLTAPLRDAAAVNTTRRALHRTLLTLDIPVHASTGGRTKYNRTRTGTPKTHALDALCVGPLDTITTYPTSTTRIACTGRGTYARTRPDKYGFPRLHLTRTKRHHGYATGDHVTAVVPAGKKAGTYTGRVAVRASGSFNIATHSGAIQGIHHRRITLIQRGNGYGLTTTTTPHAQ